MEKSIIHKFIYKNASIKQKKIKIAEIIDVELKSNSSSDSE